MKRFLVMERFLVMKRFYYVNIHMCMYFHKLYKVLLHNKTVDSKSLVCLLSVYSSCSC